MLALSRALVRRKAPARCLGIQRGSRAAARPPSSARRLCSSEKGKPGAPADPPLKPKEEPKLTREEVEQLSENARQQQRLVDRERQLFGASWSVGSPAARSCLAGENMSPFHPFVIALALGAAALHYYNSSVEEEQEVPSFFASGLGRF